MTKTLARKVSDGARFLDRVRPGWWRKVRVRRLEMTSGVYEPGHPRSCGCVLSQLDVTTHSDGDYEATVDTMRLTDHDEDRLGFNVYDDEAWEDSTEWNEAWREQVRRRRARA